MITHGGNAWRDRGKPRAYRTDPTCKEKNRYTDEMLVRAAGQVSMQEQKNRAKLWCYRCQHCHGWHLTHSDQGRRWMIKIDDPAPSASVAESGRRAIDSQPAPAGPQPEGAGDGP